MIVAALVALFVLVVARMAGLVRQQERSVARERMLSAAGAALVAATRREEIYRGGRSRRRRSLADERRRLCAASTTTTSCAATPRPRRAWPSTRHALALLVAARDGDGASASPRRRRAPTSAAADASPRPGAAAVAARRDARAARRRRRGRSAGGAASGAAALATQIALALESAALTEEVHRRASEARFGSLVQHASDLITVLDPDATRRLPEPVDRARARLRAGRARRDAFDRLVHPSRAAAACCSCSRTAPRRRRPAAGARVLAAPPRRHAAQFEVLHTNLLDDEHVRGIVLNSRDVSERKAFEEQLAHQAFHDPVTGLANRALFVERVRHALARAPAASAAGSP